MIRDCWQSSLFLLIPSQKVDFNKKKLMLKIDSAASIGGQGKYMKYVSFSWPPVVTALSIS
jgi:hypothetical protein